MSEQRSSVKVGVGIGLSGLLTIMFVTLKLIGEHFHTPVADWGWIWVLSPLWIPFAILAAIFAVAVCLAAVGALVKGR